MSRSPGWLDYAVVAVAAVTFLAGAGALLTPRLLLGLLAAEADGVGQFFLAVVGMLVVLFGGLLSRAIARPADRSGILFWVGLEKLGFAVAMTAGYLTATFGPVALAIGLVDLVSGLIVFAYRGAGRGSPAASARTS